MGSVYPLPDDDTLAALGYAARDYTHTRNGKTYVGRLIYAVHTPSIRRIYAVQTPSKDGNSKEQNRTEENDAQSAGDGDGCVDLSPSEQVAGALDVIPIPRQEAHEARCAIPSELMGLELYAADKTLCARWCDLLPAWRQAYPGVDVIAEIRKAHAWEVANKSRRKVDRPRFLGNWLSRAQDKPNKNGGAAPRESEW
jgi:hypothetical protein